MKHLAISAVLLLASLPSFASHAQPSRYSQLRLKHSHSAAEADRKGPAEKAIIGPQRGPEAKRSQGSAAAESHVLPRSRKPRKYGTGSSSSIGLVSAVQIPTGGENDDNTDAVLGDFNGDGKMDAASIVQNNTGSWVFSISVVLSNGDGTFQAPALTPTPGNTDDPIVVGDVNGDGKDDIVMVHVNSGGCRAAAHSSAPPVLGCGATIDVLISNGDGTFTLGNNYGVSGGNLNGGLLTDMNGDGKLDFVAIDSQSLAAVVELLGNGDGTFQAASTVTTLSGTAPYNIVFADFNGDGKLDFAGQSSGQVQVYLASGSDFLAPVALSTSDQVYDACDDSVGDLTGDGKPEIVSVNCGDNTVTIYVNNGDGTFQTGVYYAEGLNSSSGSTATLYPEAATIADVNGDGKNDIVSANDNGADVTILLGNGDGTVIVPTVGYATGGYPFVPPLVADFNGDGLPDVLMSDDEFSLVYLQGYGDGTFRAALNYYSPSGSTNYSYGIGIATADFNGDGLPDFVMGQSSDSSLGVTVFLSNPDGTLQSGVNYGSGGRLYYVAVADFNGDGKVDIAATDSQNQVVQIFLGNGDGTFTAGSSFPTDSNSGSYPQGIVTGDFNHDGKVDLAVVNGNNQNVGILLGDGSGGFGAPTTYALSSYAYEISAADLNGDGYLDLQVAMYGTSNVAIFLANSDNTGTFQTETDVAFPVSGLETVTVADLNGDGKADMAVPESDGSNPGIAIALGNGDGTFQAPVVYASTLQNVTYWDPRPSYVRIVDFDGDGKLDLVYTNANYATVGIMLGNGDGTFSNPVEFPAGGYAWDLVVADMDGDGTLDVVTSDDDMSGVTVLLNKNDTGAQQTYTFTTQTPSATVTAGASATYDLTMAGRNGYNGTITFSCPSGLPTGAACSFSPSSVVAHGVTPFATVLTITTTAAKSALAQSLHRNSNSGSPTCLAVVSGLGLFGLVLSGGKKNSRRRMGILLGGMLLLMAVTLVGCDNDSVSKVVTPPGSYVLTVTSTGTGTSAPTHSITETLVVQ